MSGKIFTSFEEYKAHMLAQGYTEQQITDSINGKK